MKKSTKILGSLALSAALAMGTAVPAFAEDAETPADSPDKAFLTGQGTASTDVNVTTTTTQINVTVPLAVTFALNTNGGPATAAPDVYRIINKSPVKVYVQDVTVTPGADWAAADTKYGEQGQNGTNGKIGNVYAKFSVAGSINDFTLAQDTKKNLGWAIERYAGGTSTAPYTITVNGAATPINSLAELDGVIQGAASGKLSAAATNAIKDLYSDEDMTTLKSETTLEQMANALKGVATLGKTGQSIVFTVNDGDGTPLPITISDVSSSVLTDKAPKTHTGVATITYTIGVNETALS